MSVMDQAPKVTGQQSEVDIDLTEPTPTAAELTQQFEQPAIGTEQRDPAPASPPSEHVLDLQAAQDAKIAKAQAAFASSQASAGVGMYTDGHAPMPAPAPAPGSESDPLTVDHPAPATNRAGEPVIEKQPEKKKGFFRSLLDKAQRKE